MAEREALTADYVRQILSYNPDTGEFVWRERPREHFKNAQAYSAWNSRFAGKSSGNISDGYWQININYRTYQAHRLAWLWMTGEWPNGEIDHIDCVGVNNRFANLREAAHSENMRNARKRADNASGVKGVYWDHRREKWQAQISANNKHFYLGSFDNIEDAAASYSKAARKLHGEFARTE